LQKNVSESKAQIFHHYQHYNYQSHSQLHHTIILAGYITTCFQGSHNIFNPPSNSVAVNHCAQAAVAQLWSERTSRGGIPVSARPKSGNMPEQSNSASATVITADVPGDTSSADVSKLMVTDPSQGSANLKLPQPGQQPGVNEGLNKSSSRAYNTEL